tara:strand:- start:268 stop:465 length:198 start_codon:yes stop_codon:yes gene_type:complete
MDCYNCKFKGPNAIGSAYLTCKVLHVGENGPLLDLLAAGGAIELKIGDENAIVQNKHGVSKGWCT